MSERRPLEGGEYNHSMAPRITEAPGGETFTLAHLSDPHLTTLDGVRWPELLGKRLLGYLSWHRHRRHIHLPEVLERLTADIHRQAPDHLVITGDLTQIGTPGEYRQAREWLGRCGEPAAVTVTPGNHDTYAPAPRLATLGLWQAYMTGDDGSITFPFLRRRGPVAVIALSSALPTAPLLASGRLGPGQLAALDHILEAAGREGLSRVVLIHHPPMAGVVSRRCGLDDAGAFADVLARRGAELVLHGHTHRSTRGYLPGPAGAIPVIGVPSASAQDARDGRAAAYHLYRLSRMAGGWRIDVRCRTLDAASATPRDGPSWQFEVAAPAVSANS
ncbi:MAG: metallophosphoesterase [Gammaproteobacteria bacterium]|nr:metallophosphoesterase [Gammaproteobacteria bacterium]